MRSSALQLSPQTPDVAVPVKPDVPLNPSDAWNKWKQTGETSDFHHVLRALEPTVQKGLGAYGGGRKELLTQARKLAADAAKTFSPTKETGASLQSWTYGHLQRLQRVAADRDAAVRMPERVRMDAILIRDTVKAFQDKHDFEPDLATLSDETGLSRARIGLASKAYREISTAGLETDKGDTLLTQDATAEQDPWRDYVYYDLDPKSRKIFEWTTGYGGSKLLPKQDIAVKLKMSPAAISSRISTIQKRLQERPSGQMI